jgi:hypothetical protein
LRSIVVSIQTVQSAQRSHQPRLRSGRSWSGARCRHTSAESARKQIQIGRELDPFERSPFGELAGFAFGISRGSYLINLALVGSAAASIVSANRAAHPRRYRRASGVRRLAATRPSAHREQYGVPAAIQARPASWMMCGRPHLAQHRFGDGADGDEWPFPGVPFGFAFSVEVLSVDIENRADVV